jgi:hypothetical protein
MTRVFIALITGVVLTVVVMVTISIVTIVNGWG